MKAYGVNRRDFGCCPGHDNFPKETYKNRRSIKARARDIKLSHQIGRSRNKRIAQKELVQFYSN